ncbi:PREDICTED: serine/threonine-protein kinase TBK1-like [Amphimedon queenslandica]|uniref:Protein kinase domain-containing protein n=1 Tax=Amphimedon queenslandica TaxID=400682 RepID=A0A1X7VRT9_AMPQE|nr:PREDICTED: serine/threonine-protein kinase TBK1-like [Amphimedon queenslandica]|eukprot:XP_019854889.1 PREDICTED: serine/threonine-protein kinase TBK1-like [Amphimedon queenslandica]
MAYNYQQVRPAFIGGGDETEYYSLSYIWSSKDKLGQGATGQVFAGYSKRSGDKVAIKMFTSPSEYKAMQSEMQTIKALKTHPNIVSFFELNEIEKKHQYHIIAMELCNGGSLYEVIDSPQNAYGLDEYQFKSVIFDVASGMRHLRDHGFVHRDIKPGNIMRCINPDGSFVFKLADFGTARQLDPNEHFTSLHGTEEYLYPAMYERALINYRSKEEFLDKVDLWSLGATFFHLATGRLPFRPYRKRQDRGTMFKIINEKKTGIILGWQQEYNAPIYYSDRLPPDIVISQGLRDIITPILAGVLDTFDSMWAFDRFFKAIDGIKKQNVVHIFCVSRCTCHMIYVDDAGEADIIPKFKELIARQTSLDPKHMEMYLENILFGTEPVRARDLPLTTPDSPLTVFGGPPQKPDKLATPVVTQPPNMPPETTMVDDLRYAKDCTKAIWVMYRAAETMDRYFRLMNQGALCLRETLDKDYRAWCRKYEEVQVRFNSLIDISNSQIVGLQSDVEFLQAINPLCNNAFDHDIADLQRQLEDKNKHLVDVRDQSFALHEQTKDFHSTVNSITSSSIWDTNYLAKVFNESTKTMMSYVDKVEEIFNAFQEQKKQRGAIHGDYDRRSHEYNKRTIKERLGMADKKLSEMIAGRNHVYGNLYHFLEKCTPVREDLRNLMASLDHSAQCTKEDTIRLQKWLPHHQQRMQNLLGKLPNSLSGGGGGGGGMGTLQLNSLRSLLQRARESTGDLLKLADKQKTLIHPPSDKKEKS